MENSTFYNLCLPIITAFIGAIIGTFLGSWFIFKFQDNKIEKIRKIAVKALSIFEKYDKKSYQAVSEEFNTTLNLSEKQMVLVALHKIGLPIEFAGENIFNIHFIRFLDTKIHQEEIKNMITQIKSGYCDRFFFEDIQNYFVANNRIYALRSTGKRFIKDVLARSTSKDKITYYPEMWQKDFSDGEIRSILVLMKHLNEESNFDVNGNPKTTVIEKMIRDIDRGLYDNYLVWDYEMYENFLMQKGVANLVAQQISLNNINSNKEEK
ncbi:MAG: hypothetical protein PUC42_09790 [Bacteroidales bacterium]|nr:hypothetical protein [Bacteroidales bacterium]